MSTKKEFTNYKYTFFTRPSENGEGNVQVVVANSTYGGRCVRGIAKCDPHDEYNKVVGMQLAAARCNLKVAKKRVARSRHEIKWVEESIRYYQDRLTKMKRYNLDSENELVEAQEKLDNLASLIHTT